MKPILAFWTQTFRWPFPFGLYDLSIWMIVLAVLGVVVLRFARSRHEEEQLNSEFEAARTVQQLLIPEAAPPVPGFRIESAYKPARHVGGDFFYIRPEEEDGILLVIGDVSGKGLKAALAVNLVIGALRTMPPLPPSRVLAALNRGLIGLMQGGFVTCCAARIHRDGTATFANAGHLAPYIDGREMELPAAFPLGIAAEAPFEESTLKLTPGARLTLITDGVVEARNASVELFGFERTAAISTNAVEDIAGAAQHFGQEDDITVLTLELMPQRKVVAA
jgi:sigma-B regulation protein RsbU (phosphoserine phosphatase)